MIGDVKYSLLAFQYHHKFTQSVLASYARGLTGQFLRLLKSYFDIGNRKEKKGEEIGRMRKIAQERDYKLCLSSAENKSLESKE